jgi:CRISPR/Cas system-associated exonuclease Cas4 (RecB family)
LDFFQQPQGQVRPFSPTSIKIFQMCQKRYAYTLDARFKLFRRAGTSSVLGNIAHSVLEFSTSHPFTPLNPQINHREWFEEIWDVKERELFEKFKNECSPITPISIKKWPKYVSIRSFALLESESIRGKVKASVGISQDGSLRTYFAEKKFELPEINLVGIPDLVRINGQGYEIVDYKSGEISSETFEIYSDQLHFYRLLVERNTNVLVNSLLISSPLGDRNVEISSQRQAKILRDLEVANQSVSSQTYIAKPSEEACRFCDFKAICAEFGENVFGDVNYPWLIKGKISEISRSPEASWQTVRLIEGVISKGDESEITLIMVPIELPLNVGEWISVSRGIRRVSPNQYETNWTTIFTNLSQMNNVF